MKNVAVVLFILLLAAGLHGSGTPVSFGIHFGTMTDESFSFDPLFWTAGVELDFRFNNYLMFSPEATLVSHGFKFKDFTLYPAAILNLTASTFFVGGGITKGFFLGSGASGSTKVALKLNGGLLTNQMKLTAYIITGFGDLFKDMLVGASLGFRF
jgi:hypothetical protein